MHAPNSDSTAITPAPQDLHQNAPFCTIATRAQTPPPPKQTHSPLTPNQQTALSLLCTGVGLDAAAARLHINRSTLYRWRTTHPAFRAELARRQLDLRDTASRRLRHTLLRAIHVVNLEITTASYRADRVKTALALLRHVDLPSLLAAPTDPTTPDHALDDLIRADRASRNLSPDHEITDIDRDEYLAQLDCTDDTPIPTHSRLRGGIPYPTEPDAESQTAPTT